MRLTIGLLLCISYSAQAQVFKCVDNHLSITYQALPCPKDEREKALDILLEDPEANAKALEHLKAVEAEYQARKEIAANSEKERLELLRKQLEIQNLDARLRYMQNQLNQPPYNPQPSGGVSPGYWWGPVYGPAQGIQRWYPQSPAIGHQHQHFPEQHPHMFGGGRR